MSNKDSYNDYLEKLNKLKSDIFRYTIDDKEVTEEEFRNYIIDKIRGLK